jgi:Inhibitor of growth proteins N-terminal histone-binding
VRVFPKSRGAINIKISSFCFFLVDLVLRNNTCKMITLTQWNNYDSSKSEIMQQLQQEFINRTEERVLQLKVITRERDERGGDNTAVADDDADDGAGRQPIGLQVPNSFDAAVADGGAAAAATTSIASNDDDSMEVVEESPKKKTSAAANKKKSGKVTKWQREKEKSDAAAAASASAAAAAKDSDMNNNEDIRIPTTEELWDYATSRMEISNDKNNSTTESGEQQDQQHQDDYYKILQLHQECLQKADEKVAVARQAYEMVDSVVQRLDRDLVSMESLLQVRTTQKIFLPARSAETKRVLNKVCFFFLQISPPPTPPPPPTLFLIPALCLFLALKLSLCSPWASLIKEPLPSQTIWQLVK